MGYCQKCGSYIPIDETSCLACGYDPTKERAAQGRYSGGQAAHGQYSASQGQYSANQGQHSASQGQYSANQGEYKAGRGYYANREEEPWNRPQDRDPWAQYDSAPRGRSRHRRQANVVPGDISENRYLSILCYIGFLFIIPLLIRKDSPYVRFHANQGLLLMITEIAIQIAARVVPFFGWLVGLAGGIFCLVCFFKGIGNAVGGRMERLPIIGDINLLT